MSADVWIKRAKCPTCDCTCEHTGDELNVTYNLSKMLREAGFCGWRELAQMSAREAGSHILSVLDDMAKEHDKWRAMNPENGWGDYDECLQGRMRTWAYACLQAGPKDTIGAWL